MLEDRKDETMVNRIKSLAGVKKKDEQLVSTRQVGIIFLVEGGDMIGCRAAGHKELLAGVNEGLEG